MSTDLDQSPGSTDLDSDPNDRVHHHARLDEDRPPPEGGGVRTLCGLVMAGPRPDAASLPCCPMCAAELEAVGHRCK